MALKYDAATKTVTFELIGGPQGSSSTATPAAEATLYSAAQGQRGNELHQQGRDAPQREIISGEGPLPNAAGDPAIPRAYTNS